MHLSRLAIIAIGALAFAACNDSDTVTDPSTPPLGGVRFINAVADTGSVDITMIDQIEWSAKGVALAFRAGTEYFPTEAKSRRVRVFPTSTNIIVTSHILLDTTLAVAANTRVTYLL